MNIKTKLNEAVDPVAKIQALIQQANEAYHNADNEQGGTEWPLMDKDGSPYGLSSDIKLDRKGYVIIPFTAWQYSDYSEPVKIRVLRKVGGKIQIIPGDWYEEGWKDVSKLLKKIIKDASIGVGHFKEYDPNWENSNSKEEQTINKSALRNMNKKIGRNTTAGMDYISENKTSNKKAIKLNENMLRQMIAESVKSVIKEGQMGSATDNLQQAHELLSDIMNSGFIPFASPSPSSTEKALKDAIIEAARMIDKAMYLCGQLGYGSVNRTLGSDPNASYV